MASVGTACAVAAVAVGGAVSLIMTKLPEVKTIFYVGTPKKLEIRGVPPRPAVWEAQHIYRLKIDICHSDLNDTNTSNLLVAEFMGENGVLQRNELAGNVTGCGPFSLGILPATLMSEQELKSVRISNTGGDALFIDQVEVDKDGDRLFWDGRNNGGGWCLSTDPNDYKGGWEEAASTCASSYTFSSPAN